VRPETSHRNQKVVYWAASTADSRGRLKLATPVELDVRWLQTNAKIIDPQGNTVGIDVVARVDQEITMGSIFWEGELSRKPAVPTDLYRVVKYEEVPDVKGKVFSRKVYLARHSDALPTLA